MPMKTIQVIHASRLNKKYFNSSHYRPNLPGCVTSLSCICYFRGCTNFRYLLNVRLMKSHSKPLGMSFLSVSCSIFGYIRHLCSSTCRTEIFDTEVIMNRQCPLLARLMYAIYDNFFHLLWLPNAK